jgi:hypothetical protein
MTEDELAELAAAASARIREIEAHHRRIDDEDPRCDCVLTGTAITYCAYHRDLGLLAIARIRAELDASPAERRR